MNYLKDVQTQHIFEVTLKHLQMLPHVPIGQSACKVTSKSHRLATLILKFMATHF
ncbi:hypothetical protein ACOBV8_21705 (plasmid) [Pseudoalteromonas espejiana]